MFSKQTNIKFISLAAIVSVMLTVTATAWPCTPPPPTKPEPKAGEGCGDGAQGAASGPSEPGNRVIAHTGALHESETDLVVGSVGPQYRLTRAYSNRFDDNPRVNYKGDFGWNWTSRDLMRLAVEDAGTPNPASIRICYETTLERVLYKSGDSPLKYSRASASTADDDIYDVIEQEAISGTTYWRLTKPCGRKFFFYPFSAGRKGGRLWREQDAVGNTLTYTYGADDKPASAADSVGNTVEFTYYSAGDGRDGLVKTVQWKFGGTVRQSVYYAYDTAQNLCRVTVAATNVQRTWLYVYAKGTGDTALEHNLLYVVGPEQYEAMQDDDVETMRPGTYYLKDENVLDGSEVWDPDPTTFPQGKGWSDYAYRRYEYGTSGVSKDRVTGEVAANGEALSFGYDTDPTDNAELPQDLRDADKIKMIITITYADGFSDEQAVDHLSRLRYRIRSDGTVTEAMRYDLDTSGRLTAVTYPDGRKMRYIYKTGYNPDTDAESGDATDYPSYEVVEYTEDQQTVRRVLAHSTYGVTGFPALPLTRVVYKVGDNDDVASGVEGTDKFTTDFAYNSDGTLKYQVRPQVNGLLPGEASAQDYRLGTEYTYNAAGQVVYEKQFICDSYAAATETFTNRVDQTQTKHEYYSTGASNGLLRYVIVDEGEGKLNLKTEYQYDNYRNPYKTIVDPDDLAITTEYTYDPTGRLLAVESPGGYYTANTYDADGRLVQADRYEDDTKAVQLGKAQFSYDLYGRQTVAKGWFGSGGSDYAESYTTYDNRGRVENHIDPPDADSHRHGRRYTYDKWGHVTQVAVGGLWSGDQTGSWSSSPDTVAKTAFVADHYGEGLTDTASDGYDDSVSDSDYDARARLSKVLRKKSDVNFGDSGTLRTTLQVEYTYDNRGLVTMVASKDTDGTLFNQAASTYDGMGRVVSQSIGDGGANSLTNSYAYDASGRVWRVTDPSGNHAVTEYDAAGRQVKATDGAGNITTYAYNDAGQLTRTIRKDHKPGAGTADSDYLWYVVAYAYDSEGRITRVTDEGEDTDRSGDGDGIDGTDADPETSEDFLVTETHYYDSAYETAVVTTDPLDHHTKVVYDGLGRQRWLREGGSGTLGSETYARETRFDYEKTGRQTAIVSGGPDGVVGQGGDDQTTSYSYNSHGLVASVEYPDASPNTVSYTYYTNNDALATVTDQKSVVTSYTYKAVADGSDYNVESRQYVSSGTPDGGDRDVITTADGLGQVLSVVTKDTAGGTQTSKVTRQYKFCGALWKETQQIGDSGGDSRTVEYGFDSCGKVTKLYWPHAGTVGDYVAYSDFDGLNRPRTYTNNISGNGTDLAKYTFLGARPATKDYYDGATRIVAQTFWSSSGGGTNNYDHYARLIKSHAVGDPDGTPTDVMKVGYAYDDGSNPTWRYDELSNAAPRKWSQKYQYDVMDRLTKAQQGVVGGTWPSSPSLTADKTWVWDGTVGEETYTLDKVGNWDKFYNDGTDDDRSHNAVNEITGRTIGGQTKNPTWDNTGNLTDDGENYKYVYDFRNRLVQAKRRGDNSLLAEYAYDGLNRRIRKVVYDTDGETELSDTRYLYDGWRCVEERDENESHELRARYVYGGLYIDEPLRMYRDTNSDGDFADGGDVNVYYLQDRLFNVVALTDTNGSIVERIWYEPYGQPTNRRESDGNETVASHFGNPMLFTGHRMDDETGLFHARNRQLNPGLGRWTQRDYPPYADGYNAYERTRSASVTYTDPDGRQSVSRKGPEPGKAKGKPKLESEYFKAYRYEYTVRKYFLGIPYSSRRVGYELVDYQVPVNRLIQVHIAGQTTWGTWDSAPLLTLSTVSWEWPQDWMFKRYIGTPAGFTGTNILCRKFVRCKVTCCDSRGDFEKEWVPEREYPRSFLGIKWTSTDRAYLYGTLEWDTLGGKPYCRYAGSTTEAAKTMCADYKERCREGR